MKTIYKARPFFYLFIPAVLLISCSKGEATESAAAPEPAPGLPIDAFIANASVITQEEIVVGSILPNKEVSITSEVFKKINSIHFVEGAEVSQGQLLYKLDDADISAKLRKVNAELTLAKLNESRMAALLKSASVKQEEYDVALSNLNSLSAQEELLRVELSKTLVNAPFSGMIGITKVQTGSLVNPGTALVSLQDQKQVKIQFSIPEKYFHLVRKGKTITFSTSFNEAKISATIVATESGLDPKSRSITVQAIAENKDGKLKPGMSARVYFSTIEDNTTGIMIPSEALIPGVSGYSVFLIKNGLTQFTPVQITERNEFDVLVTSGISSGDTIMTSNLMKAGEGIPVQIVTIR